MLYSIHLFCSVVVTTTQDNLEGKRFILAHIFGEFSSMISLFCFFGPVARQQPWQENMAEQNHSLHSQKAKEKKERACPH